MPLTAADLIAFEDRIAADFLAKKVRHPIHLQGGGCEEQLIGIFRDYIKPDDWLAVGWRSHLHCLLHGVEPDRLRQAILDGKSISLSFPDRRIIGSGIVGGTAPIAVGLALALKRQGATNKVVCFLGDMSARTGIAHECLNYAWNHQLPVLFVIEDNGKSVETDTAAVWGSPNVWPYGRTWENGGVVGYTYTNRFPHCGCGTWISFDGR